MMRLRDGWTANVTGFSNDDDSEVEHRGNACVAEDEVKYVKNRLPIGTDCTDERTVTVTGTRHALLGSRLTLLTASRHIPVTSDLRNDIFRSYT
jgi:hypothetical protein